MHLNVTFFKLISLHYLQEEQYYSGYVSQQVSQPPLLLPAVIYALPTLHIQALSMRWGSNAHQYNHEAFKSNTR